MEVVSLTNLTGISALRSCELGCDRWSIARQFALVKTVLHGAIENLGRSSTALLALCLTLRIKWSHDGHPIVPSLSGAHGMMARGAMLERIRAGGTWDII